MTQPNERRWAGRWGSITILRDKGYFQLSVYLAGTLFMWSFTRAEDDPTVD